MENDRKILESGWTVRINPSEDDVNALRQQLRMDNIAKVGHEQEEIGLAIMLYDRNENLVAGISGYLWGRCLEIDYLWVKETHRGVGIGSRLVKNLEKSAAGRGCATITTNTFSFQAPEFYTQLGYDVFGVVSGYGKQVQKYYLRKSL
jgi:GNAT superfamily N-acetyltransferase